LKKKVSKIHLDIKFHTHSQSLTLFKKMNNNSFWKIFKCHQCGRCCSEIGLPYDPEKIFDIAKYLGITSELVIDKYYGHFTKDRKSWESDDHKRRPCPFLKRNGAKMQCEIYPVRPYGCEIYPFETVCGSQGVECPGAKEVNKKLE